MYLQKTGEMGRNSPYTTLLKYLDKERVNKSFLHNEKRDKSIET